MTAADSPNENSRVVAIIQARMGSTRLPGKVLKPVLDKSLLEYQVERVRLCQLVDEVRIATSTLPIDDALAMFAESLGAPVTRGSERNVLARFYLAATESKAEVIVRLTADCPLIAPTEIDRVIAKFKTGGIDYASNVLERTYPRGLDTEVFSFAALKAANDEAKEPAEREHVTPFINRRPDRFRLASVTSPYGDSHQHRWTVDTPEDFELIRKILEDLVPRFGVGFTFENLLDCLRRHPDWEKINAHVEQKKT